MRTDVDQELNDLVNRIKDLEQKLKQEKINSVDAESKLV